MKFLPPRSFSSRLKKSRSENAKSNSRFQSPKDNIKRVGGSAPSHRRAVSYEGQDNIKRVGGSAPSHRRAVSYEGRLRRHSASLPRVSEVVYRYLEGAFMLRQQIMLHHAWNPRYFRVALDTGSLSHCEIQSLIGKPSSTDSNWSEPINLWQDDVQVRSVDKSTLFSSEHTYSWQLVIKGDVVITASSRSALDRSDWVDELTSIISTKAKHGNYSSIYAFQKMMNGTRAEKLKALKTLTEEVNRYIKQIMSEPGAPKDFNSMTRSKVKEFVIETFGSLAYERFKTNIRSLQATWVQRTVVRKKSEKSQLRRRILEKDKSSKLEVDTSNTETFESKNVSDEEEKKQGSVSPVRRRRSTFYSPMSVSSDVSVIGPRSEEIMLLAVEEIITEREETFQLCTFILS